jgi:hypothetical protein
VEAGTRHGFFAGNNYPFLRFGWRRSGHYCFLAAVLAVQQINQKTVWQEAMGGLLWGLTAFRKRFFYCRKLICCKKSGKLDNIKYKIYENRK